MFARAVIERYGVDLRAVQRQQGLAMMFGGSAALAAAMGTDSELAHLISKVTVVICSRCLTTPIMPAALEEASRE